MSKRLLFICTVVAFAASSVFAQATKSADRVMVLPFENASKQADFNWVGESIADSLTDLLPKDRSLRVVSNQERKIVQQRLKMPSSVLPSLAASLKLAREANASLLVAGNYSIIPESNDTAASVTVRAKVIRVREGRFMVEEFPDGTRRPREINLTDALGNLQSIQGQLAYQILLQRDKQTLPFTLNEFIESANKVPGKAFEAYIKGLLTPASDVNARAAYFRNAIRIYDEKKGGEIYGDAALELGHLFLNEREYQNALAFFARIPQKSGQYPEAAFYSGLIHWKQKNYDQALAVLRPLSEDLKLTSVYNMLGAAAVAAAVATRDDGKSAAFLEEGLEFLERASESTTKTDVFFNHGFALFLNGKFEAASEKFRPVLANDPRDGEAYFLLSKTLEKLGDSSAKDFDNQARRFLTADNRYANLESKWREGAYTGISLRIEEPGRREFVSLFLSREDLSNDAAPPPIDETAAMLAEAQKHYDAGRDDDAMAILRRILVSEPMSAETYLLLGKIHIRRGDTEQAVSSFKASYFWNNRLIEAHVLLGRIYIQKRDCLQAKNYSVSALAIDPENEDALALERQVERCSK